MDISQLFFDQRNLHQRDQPSRSQKQLHSDFAEIPEAPSFCEVSFLSSQRCNLDIQPSQLYRSSQKPKDKWFPEVISSQLSHNAEKTYTLSQKSAPNLLTSQVYHNKLKNRTPSNNKLSAREHPTASNRNHEDDEEGRHFFIPHNKRTNLFGSKRKVARDSSLNQENKSVDQDVVNESEILLLDKKTKERKRYIFPSTPLFPNGTKTSKKSLEDEVTPNQQQPRSREGQTPGKTPAFNNIRRNLCLDKEIIPTPMPLVLPSSHGIKLRSIEEIPERYRNIFKFPYFNIVQSRVFDEVFYTDKPLVVCAPTGAGKTAIFELAIVRLIMKMENQAKRNFKVVYMAPIKALCSEKWNDWKDKFEPYSLKCTELTGDTEIDDYYELQEVNIILTTPEKWDSMTRRWRDNTCFVQSVCLFCIDEIHVLNDISRGATIEAVISRMKTIQAAMGRSSVENFLPKLRFVAVSATIPNIDDIAEWLGDDEPAVSVKMDDSLRPVRLRKVVLGFYFNEEKGSAFHFDMSLNYKLAGIIHTYSEDKPTLVFCSTRKSTQQAGETLAKDSRGTMIKSTQQRQKLLKYANMVKDNKLRDLVMKGIGFHHAGMDLQDRKYMEELFASGDLPVLVATSTLAMGVNLPAHLVILKSTQYYNMGCHEEYSDTQILQMIGRAGRPQFDTTATAVIMTKNQTKAKYEDLLNGTQVIESSLHRHLVEHLNAEIVLHTINDMSIAMEWIRYTFLYIRVMKNPKHYGMPEGLNKDQVEKRLQDLCMKNLNELEVTKMISMDEETFDVKPTEAGRLMARYCIAFETMKKFCNITGTESAIDLINLLTECEEFTEVQLRTNEKRTLNTLNKDKNRMTVRFPIQGKIKTKQMKVNVLIQAALGSLTVQDFSLQQDTSRIFRAANRISRCLLELLWLRKDFKSLLNAAELCKCFRARLWEDSKYITKQLDGIGPTLSNALVNAGITSFQKIEDTNPRELELIVNRHPPFGNQVRDSVAGLPKYELTIEQVAKYSNSSSDLWLHLNIANKEQYKEKKTASSNHTCVLLIGDEDNKIVYNRKIMDIYLLKDNGLTKKLEIKRADKGPDLFINLISQDWVGLDVQSTYTPFYSGPKKMSSIMTFQNQPYSRATLQEGNTSSNRIQDTHTFQDRAPCNHSCMNKRFCGHDCCRNGVISKTRKIQQVTHPVHKEIKRNNSLNNFMSDLKSKMSYFPETPSTKRLKMSGNIKDIDLNQFAYNRRTDSLPGSAPPTSDQGTSTNTFQQRDYTPEIYNNNDKSSRNGNLQSYIFDRSMATPQKHQRNSDVEYEVIDDWKDLDLETDFIDNEFQEMGNETLSEKWQQNQRQRNTEIDSKLYVDNNKTSDCELVQYGGNQVNNDNKVDSTRSGMGGNCCTNTDWTELDMYQKRREQLFEDFDYELPDVNTDEYGNVNRDDHADFQLQSSLLPTQYNMSNTKQDNYYDIRDCHVLGGRHDRHDDLSQTPHRAPAKKPPLTPHRYGQVLAWSNTPKHDSPGTDWSGSDSEMITADTIPDNSCSLYNRDKELLYQHIADISSKPSIKKVSKQDQAEHNQPTYNAKQILENQPKYDAKQILENHVNENKWMFQKPGVLTENKSQIENTSDLYQPSMYVQQNRFTRGSNVEHLKQNDRSDNTKSSLTLEYSNPSTESVTDSKGDGRSTHMSFNNFFSTQTSNNNHRNTQDTFNSIFDGIF